MSQIAFSIDNIAFLRDLLDFLDLRKASYTVSISNDLGSVFKVQVLKCSEIEELRVFLAEHQQPCNI